MDKKFLGICIVVASVIISGTFLFTSLFTDTRDRYKVAGARVFDTREGKFIEVSPTPMPIQKASSVTSNAENIHVSMDDVNKLLDRRHQKEYLTPDEREILTAYYRTQLAIWAKQFNDDVNAGKVSGVSKYDIQRIEGGGKPQGIYIKDKPSWYDELPLSGGILFSKYIIDK